MLFTRYLFVLAIVAILLATFFWLRKRQQQARREQLYSMPLKKEWANLLRKYVPLASKVPEHLQPIYHGHINYFLASKTFVGRGGFVVDDRTRITIAGNACLLVLTRSSAIFPGFETIIVYPETYQAPGVQQSDGLAGQSVEHRAGESWYRGPIVLAWSNVETGSIISNDGHNVVIHEFAHKLDEENQLMNGLPILKDRSHYSDWAEVLGEEYQSFLKRVDSGSNKVIDSYGAVSPVEFFAVITESFFEKPQLMKMRLPELYEQLLQYYGVDTANW